MKKRFFFAVITLLLTIPAFAKPVDKKVAAQMARDLLRKEVMEVTPQDFTEFYLFVGADGHGFALIAATDLVSPILGYSREGVFPTDRELPHHIAAWLKGYQYDIAETVKAGIEAPKFNHPRDTAVGPLMTTTWNQRPRYNSQCPYSAADSAYTVTGCVATATAQVMKYWNHPAVGRGSHSYTTGNFPTQSANFDTTHYDWAHMPDALDGNSTEEEIAAVAQLMHHVGIAVEMKYRVNASSAAAPSRGRSDKICAENALKNYFRYNQSLFSAARIDFSNEEWDSLLTSEFNASRPVLYSGRDYDSGHAFVLDGYDSLGLYHVNWGWGGSCDGFYTFDNLSPSGSGVGGNPSNAYNNDCWALFHVFPASENPSVTVNIVNANPEMGTVTGGGTFPSYTPITISATAPEGYRFLTWKSGNHANPLTISPNNDYTDTAVFAPLYGDTLGYCFGNFLDLWGEYTGYASEWGIRIPAGSIPAHRQLNAVQFFGVSGAETTIKVYLGDNFDRMIFSTTYTPTENQWYTVPLPTSTPLIDGQLLWIVLSCGTYSNPVMGSSYSGNPDGCWYKRSGTTWEHLVDRNEYMSWMIRAILGELQQVDIVVESNDPVRGTVTGSGSYYPGDTAILTATPADGYRFAGWSTGDRENPLHMRVTTPETIIGTFVENTGIEDVEANELRYSLNGLVLTVFNPTAAPVCLYDIQGRQIAKSQLSTFNFQFTTPGVYLLHCGPAVKRIVVL